jgi:CBS domain-containing protein
MRVVDVMQREVVTVSPGASLKQAAELLVGHGISGLPVVDADGRVLGVFSETDLLFKEQGEPDRPTWRAWLVDPLLLVDREKLAARTVGEAMTAPAQTIASRLPIAQAAKLMLGAGVNRLPVVDEGKLVGIVTRADLVRAFVRSDAEIAKDIRSGVVERGMWLDSRALEVKVDAGEVTLSGSLDSHRDAELLPRLVGAVPGVVAVASHLTWREPDLDE